MPLWMIAIIWRGRHVLFNKVLLSGNSVEKVKDDDLSLYLQKTAKAYFLLLFVTS